MALDYFFSMKMNSDSIPVLRFYGWEPYCLSLGKHQAIENISFGVLKSDGYDSVRRPTGGSAIFHSEELTYSFIIPLNLMSHHVLYEVIHSLLNGALNQLGYKVELHTEHDNYNYMKEGNATFACFNRSAHMEIKYKGRKLVGSAQKIYKNSVLQHGSILIGDKQKEILKYLDVADQKRESALKFLKSNSVCLKEISESLIGENELSDKIISYIKSIGIEISDSETISDIELNEAKNYIDAFKV